ncbi:unnamed protein product [Rhizoctonia solani]|uniref:Uncharacterized protein n=1 Tax=Rhizoctonia solani TaxID=456999 RepID=A0A8H2ZZM4_9AGAM|nr:unnamed protein product [Rhizoctonia solani]
MHLSKQPPVVERSSLEFSTILLQGVPCCDVCDPSVLDNVRVPPPEKKQRVVQAKKGRLNNEILSNLVAWREKISSRPDAATGQRLATLLEKEWGYWGRYGGELVDHLKQGSVVRQSASSLLEAEDTARIRIDSSKKGAASILEAAPKYNKKREGQTSDLRDAAQTPEATASYEVKGRPARSKKPRESNEGLTKEQYSEPQVIWVAPASPHSQWRVSTTPMLPDRMTPVVPSQKRATSPDSVQNLPRKLRLD